MSKYSSELPCVYENASVLTKSLTCEHMHSYRMTAMLAANTHLWPQHSVSHPDRVTIKCFVSFVMFNCNFQVKGDLFCNNNSNNYIVNKHQIKVRDISFPVCRINPWSDRLNVSVVPCSNSPILFFLVSAVDVNDMVSAAGHTKCQKQLHESLDWVSVVF